MAQEANCRISKQRLMVERLIGEKVRHLTLSRMVGFPLPVSQIWRSQAQIQAVTGRVRDDKVLVEGKVAVQIFWVPAVDNREICELKLEEGFSQFVEIPGAARGQLAEVRGRVERMGYTRVEVKGSRASSEEASVQLPQRREGETEDLSPDQDQAVAPPAARVQAEVGREPDALPGETDQPEARPSPTLSAEGEEPQPQLMADAFRQDLLLELEVKVRQGCELDVITQVEIPGIAAKVRKEKLWVEEIAALGGRDLSLTRQIHFPRPAAQVKGSICRMVDLRAKAEPGKICYQGICQQQLLYSALENRRIYEMTLEEPISGEVPVAGASPEMRVEIYGYLTSAKVEGDSEERDGYLSARSELGIHLAYRLLKETQLEAITEVRAPGLVVDKGKYLVDAIVARGQGEEVLTREIAFPRPVARLAASCWQVGLNREDTAADQDEVMVAARLKEEFLAVDYCHGGIFSFSPPDHPVEFLIQAPGARPGLPVRVEVRVERVDRAVPPYPEEVCQQVAAKTFHPEAFPWQEELVVGATAWVMEPRALQLVKAVKLAASNSHETPEVGPRASIRYYLIQPGDTWDAIGERYGIAAQSLRQLNPELVGGDGYELPAGQRLRLPSQPQVVQQGADGQG